LLELRSVDEGIETWVVSDQRTIEEQLSFVETIYELFRFKIDGKGGRSTNGIRHG
jgi:hypothetical protein